MANNPSAVKRMRQSEVRRQRNRAAKSRMRTAIKQLRESLVSGDAETAAELLPGTLSLIDATAGKQVIHRNAAARYKSRLTRAVAAARAS